MIGDDGERRKATPSAVLEFEAAQPSAYMAGRGAATRIRAHFGMTSTAYHALLEAMLRPDGPHLRIMLDLDPITTNTLIDRRARAIHTRARMTGQPRPASPYCESGSHPGCTCDICY